MGGTLALAGDGSVALSDFRNRLEARLDGWAVRVFASPDEAIASAPDWLLVQGGETASGGSGADELRRIIRSARKAGCRVMLLPPAETTPLLRRAGNGVRRLSNEEGTFFVETGSGDPDPAALADRVERTIRPFAQIREGRLAERNLGPLPDLRIREDGSPVKTASDWPERRRELLDLVLEYEYGPLPPVPETWSMTPLHPHALDVYGGARHAQFKLEFGERKDVSWVVDVLTPDRKGPFPVILNGDGCWQGYLSDRITEQVLERGFRYVRFNRCECAPDVREVGPINRLERLFPGQAFSALASWAWAYHRTLDFILGFPDTDPARTGVFGHSRGGKASLLAGATDPRIALTGASMSGCGGAGCFRILGPSAETLADILGPVSFWFTPRLKGYIGREAELPVDQHMVKALVAPRGLFTVEGLDDLWANPLGTRATYEASREVYRLLGAEDRTGIRFLPLRHAFGPPVWEAYLDFADWIFSGKPLPPG